MAPSEQLWDVLLPSNSKWAYIFHELVKLLTFPIWYILWSDVIWKSFACHSYLHFTQRLNFFAVGLYVYCGRMQHFEIKLQSDVTLIKKIYYLGGVDAWPGFSVAPQQVDKGLDLFGCDVLFQQLAVVVQQGSNCVLCQNLIPNLSLHDWELFGYIFLQKKYMFISTSALHGVEFELKVTTGKKTSWFLYFNLNLLTVQVCSKRHNN